MDDVTADCRHEVSEKMFKFYTVTFTITLICLVLSQIKAIRVFSYQLLVENSGIIKDEWYPKHVWHWVFCAQLLFQIIQFLSVNVMVPLEFTTDPENVHKYFSMIFWTMLILFKVLALACLGSFEVLESSLGNVDRLTHHFRTGLVAFGLICFNSRALVCRSDLPETCDSIVSISRKFDF